MSNKDKKKVFFIGIAGKTMAPLAKAFKDKGWEVSGSDKERVYPPISTYLMENNLQYFQGFKEENVPTDADLVVIGRYALLFKEGEAEYRKAKNLNLNICSYPEVLQKYVIKENSIVVAGTFGKTTISSLVAWILINAGLNPSYMTGGIPLNMNDGVKITDSSWSVVEGDEAPALHESDPPKFLFYQPKYLVLTATLYDHPEVFKTKKDYLSAFSKLVRMVPKNGMMIYHSENVAESVVGDCQGKKIPYSAEDVKQWETSLLGKFNLENITAAFVLCSSLGIGNKIILDSIASFKGVKTRLEFMGETAGRFIYWDIAQHPLKVKGSLEALRDSYPQSKIWCVYDPSMTGLKYKESLEWYPGAFDQADRVIVGKVGFLRDLKGKDRVLGKEITAAIAKTQKNVFYEPKEEKLIDYLVKESQAGEAIVFMSSGGLRFTKLIEKVREKLKGPAFGGIRRASKMDKKYEKIINFLGKERVLLNEPLANQTTFKIGGPADLFYVAETETESVGVLRVVREVRVPYFILGGGSNVLAGDKGFRGVIIKLSNCKLRINNMRLLASAGVSLATLVSEAVKNSLTGLEFAVGIPGTVGGAVRGNAGAWQKSISDTISRVKIITEDGEIKWMKKEEFDFAYRTSRFKKNKEIILEVELEMGKGDKKKIEEQVREYLKKRESQPREPSAGCIFVNPKPASAGALIDQCGLKGLKIGQAQISEKHANFIVNLGGAKAIEVVALIDMIKTKVKEKFNIDLLEEIVRIGEF